MPVLTLDYRHCDRMRPKYLRHLEVEAIALQAREQLVDSTTDAIPLAVLRAIGGLKINRIGFELYVDTDNPVHDETGNPILGLCEYDPAAPDAALVAVCPVGEDASEELVLSTLAHELGARHLRCARVGRRRLPGTGSLRRQRRPRTAGSPHAHP